MRSLSKRTGLLILLLAIMLVASCGRSEDEPPYVAPDVPDLPNETASFVAVGDFGVGNDDEAAVARAMRSWVTEHGADAFLSAGDNVYPEAEAEYFEAAWTIPFGWVDDAHIPVIPASGTMTSRMARARM